MSSIRSFIPLQKLGEGTYSNVYKVRRVDDNEVYALKKVKLSTLSQKQKQNSLNEVRILASIQSPNIVEYKQAFFDQSLNVLCVVMEYANDGDVQKMIKSHAKSYKRIEEGEIWLAAQHILKGLQTLHSRGILHRDLKCANIFRHNSVYKLGDLNVSKVNASNNNLCYTQTGTPYYASPQVWRDQPYDSKSDIWSFGCILYQMAELRPPFNGKDMEQLFRNVQKAKISRLSNEYSVELWQFVCLCLQKEAHKRLSASQLLKYLKKYHCTSGTSGVKLINSQSNKLLKTIKVPSDLKKLNQALPISKYKKENNNQQKINEKKKQARKEFVAIEQQVEQKQKQILKKNKSSLSRPQLETNIENNDSKAHSSSKKMQSIKLHAREQKENDVRMENDVKMKKNQRIQKPTQNKSAIHLSPSLNQHEYNKPTNPLLSNDHQSNSYRSPKNNPTNRLAKSPASQMRLGKKVESRYSQNFQQSDRKPSTASKVERMQHRLNQMSQLFKKPISMPRTEKSVVNSSHLIQPTLHQVQVKQQQRLIQNNYSYLPENYSSGQETKVIAQKNYIKHEALDDWRNRLVKKNRILSSGLSKPSWW